MEIDRYCCGYAKRQDAVSVDVRGDLQVVQRRSMRTLSHISLLLLLALGAASTSRNSASAAQSPVASVATVKALRCTFKRSAIGGWAKTGDAEAAIKPATLTLRLEAIDADSGSAQLKTGSMTTEVIARLTGGYLHFMQAFRTGPLYTTTVFDNPAGGAFKAVHSRHEYFTVAVPGATSSPEQYYGECIAAK